MDNTKRFAQKTFLSHKFEMKIDTPRECYLIV